MVVPRKRKKKCKKYTSRRRIFHLGGVLDANKTYLYLSSHFLIYCPICTTLFCVDNNKDLLIMNKISKPITP